MCRGAPIPETFHSAGFSLVAKFDAAALNSRYFAGQVVEANLGQPRSRASIGAITRRTKMGMLIAAAIVFLAIHFLVSGTRLRDAITGAIGERPYMGLFALASLAAIVWLCWA